MDYKLKKKNYDFWVKRLKENIPEQVCTNDIAFDEVEDQQILSRLKNDCSILEIGCGTGILYEKISKKYNVKNYIGTDFVSELIDECNKKTSNKNHKFQQLDMTEVSKDEFIQKFDFIISKRAVQNVLDEQAQLHSIDDFGFFLKDDGYMILVESSKNAQNRLNNERAKYNLHEIIPPFINLFFDDDNVKNYKFKNVKLVEIVPFASDFYYITRLIYARYAKEYLNEKTSYEHPLEKIAISMADSMSTKDYSQIQTYVFKKK
jgi:ubiquinone/menaquinone biosynthesis C-methylase UbiE